MALGEEMTEDTELTADGGTTTVLTTVLVTVMTGTPGTADEEANEDREELRTTLVNFDGAAGMETETEGAEIEEGRGIEGDEVETEGIDSEGNPTRVDEEEATPLGEGQELAETVLILVEVCVTVKVLWRVKGVPSTYAVAVAAGTKVVVTTGTFTVVVDVTVTLTERGEGPKLATKGLGGFGPAFL